IAVDLSTPLAGGLSIEVRADRGPNLLAVDVALSHQAEPLPVGVLRGGETRRLNIPAPRPGSRLWVVVSNLGNGTSFALDEDAPGQGYSVTFRRLPER